MKLLAIAIGGSAGALARHAVAVVFGQPTYRGFPWATLVVNVSGGLGAGFLFALLAHRWPHNEFLRSGVLVGFFGAYTTFSAFSLQTQQLIERGSASVAGLNVLASVMGAVGAAWIGLLLGRTVS